MSTECGRPEGKGVRSVSCGQEAKT